ncbi:MAG: nucleoside phosphorylase [Cytophagales bacterium]|nr:nucleoside phosphorylase [Bernardetiaceae bacterium]MDW8204157.1 nucleoside phosphorylase [Cytophagales bacterium]
MFAPSELILNPDGSIYHLHLQPEHLSTTVIVVGDPDRVAKVSRHFDRLDFQTRKREFVTHTGSIGSKRITVISSGIGTDNVEILLTELDALANIDLLTRTIKPQHTCLNIIRIGTSGALQADIPVGSRLISIAAAGLDNLMNFYDLQQSHQQRAFCVALQQATGLPFTPYRVSADAGLVRLFAEGSLQGITLTTPGFYAPQGRHLRAARLLPRFLEQCAHFQWNSERLANFEMETAAYYAFAELLGHRAVSLNAILANRILQQFDENPQATVDSLIQFALAKIVASDL